MTTRVTIEFESEEKAQAFREYIGEDSEIIRWNPWMPDAYGRVWIAEEEEEK